ncbi:hypothetical protein F4678DRAFT_480134 [Xylaria arbuscula]|nr:hypothetical protein F4678DRAFT_480134 [Xylaria arbuscula]
MMEQMKKHMKKGIKSSVSQADRDNCASILFTLLAVEEKPDKYGQQRRLEEEWGKYTWHKYKGNRRATTGGEKSTPRLVDQTRQMTKRKRDIYEQTDGEEGGLFASMNTKSLDQIVTDGGYLYTTPPFWTRSHERILHVVWQPFRPCLLDRQAYLQHTQHLGLGQRRQEEMQQTRQASSHSPSSSDSQRTIPQTPRRRLSWNSQHKLQSTPSQLQERLLSPAPPLMPNLALLFFELLEDDWSLLMRFIDSLQNEGGSWPKIISKSISMQGLLSGVDKHNVRKVLDNFSPSDVFLRRDTVELFLYYGMRKCSVFPDTFAYRLDSKRSGGDKANSENTCGDGVAPFWRMVHLDCSHLASAVGLRNRFGRNFRNLGIRRRGMTMDHCTVRYDYQRGYGKWSQPHFIPGVFIAMEQRYRRGKWMGQKNGDNNQQENKRREKRERKGEPERNDKHPAQDEKGGDASSADNGQVVTASGPTPIWQILFTDGQNDHVYAHLYTAQVPPFLVDCFDKPSQWHSPNPTTSAESNGAAENKNGHGHAQDDAAFEFRICHTRIKYLPYESFRQRLRRAIVRSHYEYSVTEKEAGPLGTDEWESEDEEPEDEKPGGEPEDGEPEDGEPTDTSD